MAKTMLLLKPVHTHVKGKRVSTKRAESSVKFNLAAMVSLAELTGVPVNLLLNEALEDFINTERYLATDCGVSRKQWEEAIDTPEVHQRCDAALRALNPHRDAVEDTDQSSIDDSIRDLDPDNE